MTTTTANIQSTSGRVIKLTDAAMMTIDSVSGKLSDGSVYIHYMKDGDSVTFRSGELVSIPIDEEL